MKKISLFLIGFLVIACSSTNDVATVTEKQVENKVKKGMVVTANPHATEAGAAILRQGGSAVDAAVAIESVLSLVEPQSSGLGGGGFMVHYDAETKKTTVYDGRETAPAKATETMFLKNGERMPFIEAKNSGLSTGVPGVVAMLSLAHSEQGALPWSELFADGIRLATDGFEISPRLFGMTSRFKKYVPQTLTDGPIDAFEYFYATDGEPHPVGYKLKNAEYAGSLKKLSQDADWFYQSEFAAQIVNAVQQTPRAGTLSVKDIANYQAKKVEPLCITYREYKLCGPQPASSWVAVGEIMGILENIPQFGQDQAQDWLSFGEAQRLAYADRDQYVADTDFVRVPLQGMLNKEYLKLRAQQIGDKAVAKIKPGNPWGFESLEMQKAAELYGEDATEDFPSTTHFVVVDGDGDVVSMTASVESIFGSTRMVGGMFLNNQLTDFSFQPRAKDGKLIANKVAANKRPRSSMSPTIVTDKDGNFVMATGSPGGNSIIAYTAKSLIGVLDWGLTPQEAVALPNMVARGDKLRIEDSASEELIISMKDYGFDVQPPRGENSGLSVVQKGADGRLVGGVDPRREGTIAVVEIPLEQN